MNDTKPFPCGGRHPDPKRLKKSGVPAFAGTTALMAGLWLNETSAG